MNRLEHLLCILGEECTETHQRVSKAMRFGLNEIQPGQDQTNVQGIVYEFNDIFAMMEMLLDEKHIDQIIDRAAIEKKKIKVEKFLEFSRNRKTLSESL